MMENLETTLLALAVATCAWVAEAAKFQWKEASVGGKTRNGSIIKSNRTTRAHEESTGGPAFGYTLVL